MFDGSMEVVEHVYILESAPQGNTKYLKIRVRVDAVVFQGNIFNLTWFVKSED
jgi:hypothetical protein